MVTKDDSRSTYEYDKHYIIYPNFEWVDINKSLLPGGILVEEGFEYNSGNNTKWLSSSDLEKALKSIK